MRYVHTNLIAKDWKKLSAFYQRVFQCRPVPPPRDLRGDWLSRLTGLKDAHIAGEHLALPGYDGDHPTLEIFSYDVMADADKKQIHRPGFAHMAFEVEDVESVLRQILNEGGGQLGELVQAEYPNNVVATFVYARDPEGNILELQSWSKRE
jgi:predicted enzyme related to lactoylglutathione lyase